jgi:hypothetical protein
MMSPEDISENFGESQLKIVSLLNIIDNEIDSCLHNKDVTDTCMVFILIG